MKPTLALFLLSSGLMAQVTINPSSVTTTSDGQYVVNVWMSTSWVSGTQTTLAAPLTPPFTALTLASGAGIGNNSLVLIDGGTAKAEIIQLSAKSGAVYTATPAIVPAANCASTPCTIISTSQPHAIGATVQLLNSQGTAALDAAHVYNNFGKQIVVNALNAMQAQIQSPTVAALQAQIVALQAQIAAANTAAVQ